MVANILLNMSIFHYGSHKHLKKRKSSVFKVNSGIMVCMSREKDGDAFKKITAASLKTPKHFPRSRSFSLQSKNGA